MTESAAPGASVTVGQVVAGQAVPPFTIPLTVQRLVMEAAANRDFTPLHHDRDAARATGAPDMFANTMFLQTLLEVTLRQWMGPGGRLRSLRFQIRRFNCPGDLLTCRGVVTAVRTGTHEQTIDVDMWVEAGETRTVVGSATLTWDPRRRPAGGVASPPAAG